MPQTTYSAKPGEIERNWYVIDAEGETLGRLVEPHRRQLRGKHKPTYTPHVDTGDFVVVINAERIHVTGNKLQEKIYYRHSGTPAGSRSARSSRCSTRRPEEVIRQAVSGMLPQQQARPRAAAQAQGVRRRRPPARGPAAAASAVARAEGLDDGRDRGHLTAPASARRR